VRAQYGQSHNVDNTEDFWKGKVISVNVDLTEEKFGMNETDYLLLAEEVDVVINVAASVDFILRLDLNMKINALGALNTLKFAKACPKICAYCHVSTCYVSTNLPDGNIDEKVQKYNENIDLETYVYEISHMSPDEAIRREKEIIGDFPNTYMFTKNVAEQLLHQQRGNLPMTIVRPAIIG
jgi:thioester reductase-like protein